MVQTDSSSMLNVCPFFKFNNELIQIFKYTYKYNTYTFKIFFLLLKEYSMAMHTYIFKL